MSYSKSIYHSKSSTYFGARVVCPLIQAVTKRNATLTPTVGVNDSYINNNLNYVNITQQLVFFVGRPTFYRDWFTWEMDFRDWLTGKDKFVKYEPFYFEPFREQHWEACLSESPIITPQKDNIANVTMSLAYKPFLVNNETIKYQSVSTMPVYNPTRYSSLPLFYIVRNGGFTLIVNGIQYRFKGTDDELFIDSGKWIAYRSLTERRTSRTILPNYEYPVLVPGKNTVSLQGNYSKFEYQPRWR